MSKLEAFFVTPIGTAGSAERSRADNVLNHVIEPAIGELFEVTRADQVSSAGSINHDIMLRLHRADLVIADLTGTNANVMYEIGIRHSFNFPIVQLAQSGEKLPFDLGDERTIFFDITDLSQVHSARNTISEYTNNAIKGGYLSPVKRSLNIEAIYEAGNPVAQVLEDIKSKIDDLSSDVSSISLDLIGLDTSDIDDTAKKVNLLHQLFSNVSPHEIDAFFKKK